MVNASPPSGKNWSPQNVSIMLDPNTVNITQVGAAIITRAFQARLNHLCSSCVSSESRANTGNNGNTIAEGMMAAAFTNLYAALYLPTASVPRIGWINIMSIWKKIVASSSLSISGNPCLINEMLSLMFASLKFAVRPKDSGLARVNEVNIPANTATMPRPITPVPFVSVSTPPPIVTRAVPIEVFALNCMSS